MNKLLAVALVALTASVAFGGAASAAPIKKDAYVLKGDVLNKLEEAKMKPKSGFSITVGEAFYANQPVVNVRAECLAAGHTPKRRFDGTEFVWVCLK